MKLTKAQRVPAIVAEASEFNWFQWHRLDWIDEMLDVYGFINREHICRKFDLSVPAASNDLRIFQRMFPDKIAYDRSAKHYFRTGSLSHGKDAE